MVVAKLGRSNLRSAVVVGLAICPLALGTASAFADSSGGLGTNAIIGTGALKGVSTDAIIGTGSPKRAGTNAIIGTGALKGVSTDAIIGTGSPKRAGTNAIIGTGALKGVSTDAIIGTGSPHSEARRLLVYGSIEGFNVNEGTVTLLGRTLRVSDEETLSLIASEIQSGNSPKVAVFGRLSASGKLQAPTAVLLNSTLEVNTTEVILAGRVSRIDRSVGQLTLGSQLVDFTPLMHNDILVPRIGSMMIVKGTKTEPTGAIVAASLLPF